MSNDKWHRQCNFKSGNTHTTAWIPEESAKVGKQVKFIDKDLTDIQKSVVWDIVSVGETRRKKGDIDKKAKFGSLEAARKKK